MVGVETAPEVHTVIKMVFLSWKEAWAYKLEPSNRVELEEAFEAQEQMEWQAFIERCVSTKWKEAQINIINGLGPTNLAKDIQSHSSRKLGMWHGTSGNIGT